MKLTVLEACMHAAEIVKAAGFELRYTSRQSEACYYALPGRHALLRIATHGQKCPPIGLAGDVVAKITFNANGCDEIGKVDVFKEHLDHKIEMAIGRYVIRSSERATGLLRALGLQAPSSKRKNPYTGGDGRFSGQAPEL